MARLATNLERRRTSPLGNLGIQTKLALAFGVLLLLFGATSLLYSTNLHQVRDARTWAERTQELVLAIREVEIPILRQQAALRGYLITFDPSFLDPYEEAGKDFMARWQRVKGLTADDPQQQALLDQVMARAREWWQFEDSLMELAKSTGKQLEIQEQLVSGRSTVVINQLESLLQQMNEHQLGQLRLRTNALDDSLQRTLDLSLIMLLAGSVFVLVVVYLVSRHIGQPLTALTGIMTRLAAGDISAEIPDQRRGDEVGALARGLEKFRIANADLLGREWGKTQQAELSIALQSAETEDLFAKTLLEHVVRATEAVSGAVFILHAESGKLVLAGGYGVPDESYAARSFAPGEGLVGQAAADGQPRILDKLPEDFFAMRSALGQSKPRILHLLPLAGRDRRVLGVLELALFSSVESSRKQFLDAAAAMAGLILETLRADLETRKLLHTTQKQSEVLRAQEEEMRATNETLRDKQRQLEEQAQQLRASEEELRAQSEELRLTNSQLEEKTLEISQQKNELEHAQVQLKQKALDLQSASQYKSDFLANMSHELRTPLNSLLILAKGLADNDGGNLTGEQLESARIVYDSGKSLLALINDILDLSKIEAGKMDAVIEEFALKGFVAGIERNFRVVARERKLAFKVEIAPVLPAQLRSDSGKLAQIVTNLLSNAFKFTHQGSVGLHVERPDPAVAAAMGLDPQRCVAFRVSDSGIGIEPDKLRLLFQVFEQGDSGTSRRYGGTGLGLSICRGLARLLGGEVSVRSEPGKGSNFTLVVPEQVEAVVRAASAAAAPPARPAQEPRPVPAPAALATALAESAATDESADPAILIVEDDRQFAEVLGGMARAKGYRVLVANDGESALQLAARNRLAGVLLDITLPGIDGWQVMQWLKDNPRTQQVPVHFISAADEGTRALAMGAAGFLRKPVTQEQMGKLFDVLPAPGAAPRRILLIDDSAKERLLVRELLRDEKVEIDECVRAEDALEKMTAQSYDLIILDLGLPGMDGFEFLEVASKRGSMPPVVVHSGRDLTREESMKLREYTDSVVLKSAPNTRRLLDEVTLFLHSIRRVGAAPEPAPRKPASLSVLAGKTALIVDDDMRNMFALSKALRSHGLKVVMAQDGPKALTQLDNSPEISIVLMDIMMPGMDGYEAMQKIRAQQRWQKLPIIAVTAKAMTGDREKCLAAGANDYCPKPIDVDELVDQMSRLMV